ncbi:hypothetical protein FKP32DRAFT_942396 [Trametes sanguinea]|nr:hypothetical protein FKP32DRAFT_942396 [Trametes sanguinea]
MLMMVVECGVYDTCVDEIRQRWMGGGRRSDANACRYGRYIDSARRIWPGSNEQHTEPISHRREGELDERLGWARRAFGKRWEPDRAA